MRKKSDTVRYTDKQIKAKIARGEDRTDWRKANAVIGKKLETSIRADVDDICEEPDWAQAVMGVPAPKDHINIRVDHDVLEWFKASGRGYQTLINKVLRAFVKSRQSPPTRRKR
ncbi:MAG: BrnA antitoxin family protein [Acidobacteriota bacterium]|nr:BrnA antitoxin family protein [Acidobacteriota bacterium]